MRTEKKFGNGIATLNMTGETLKVVTENSKTDAFYKEALDMNGKTIRVGIMFRKLQELDRPTDSLNFQLNGHPASLTRVNFINITLDKQENVIPITKEDAILTALLDAQDNGDLYYHDNSDEDDRANKFISEEIDRLSKIVNKGN